ncbi:MAG: NAD(P)/FAD-dependent oxidoreductase [Candidatus Promineifilaceae bacterium]
MTFDKRSADVLICGSGIAGVATAYFLARHHGVRDIVIVDERPPLTLTSDKSSEGYRNWWPGPGDEMVQLMNRSIDLLEELAVKSDNRFHMNRRGYVYLTADPERAKNMEQQALEIEGLGAGALRTDRSYEFRADARFDAALDGADLVRDPAVIAATFPFLSGDTVAMLHARRCGWLSAQQLGMYLLEEARSGGVRFLNGRVSGVSVENDRVQAVQVYSSGSSETIKTGAFVIAAGPLLHEAAGLFGIDLPVYNEAHGKIAFEDSEGVINRDAPLMIWNDPIRLPWSSEEKKELAAYEETSWLLEALPAGLHFRPEGGPGSKTVLALWPYHISVTDRPAWPLKFEPEFAEVIMRGLTRMIPGLAVYLDRMGRPVIDGGYYTKTRENRPLICPLPVAGAYVIGALSGFGIMAGPAAAELLAAHITGAILPPYAAAFDLVRYQDPTYVRLLESWDPTSGQL